MTSFPDQPMELTAEVALGADLTADPSTWVWTPLGNDTVLGQPRLLNDPITIQRGTAVGAGSAQTTSATIKVLNNDGWLTPFLATSPWWPYIDAGTPIRLRMRTSTDVYASDTFTRTVSNGWGTTTTGGYTWAPGTASQYNVTGTAGTITFTATGGNKLIKLPLAHTNLDVVFDASASAVATGVANIVGPSFREDGAGSWVWAHIEFGIGGIIQCTVREDRAGTAIVGLAQVTQPGLTYTAGTVIRGRAQVSGARVRMKAWLASGTEPAAWTVDVPVTIIAAGNGMGIRSQVIAGNTNTLPFLFSIDNISITQAPADRVEGYIADVQPTFLPQAGGTTWSTVQIQIAGVGSRLEKNQSPAYSPLRRSIQLSNPPPIAYWPCEDDEGSLSAASAFPGQQAMQVTGPAVFAFTADTPSSVAFLSRWGSKPQVSIAAGAKLTGVVPLSTVNNQWAISLSAEFLTAQVPLTSMRVITWDTPTGTFNRWALIATPPGYTVRGYNDSAGTTTDIAVYTTVSFFGQLTYTVEAEQAGGSINVRLYGNDLLLASGSATATLSAITRVVVNPDKTNTTASVDPHGIRFVVGHIRVGTNTALDDLPYYNDPDTGNQCRSDYAWYLESAHRRLNRLCAEERVPFTWIGSPAGNGLTILNAQQDGGFTDLTTAAAEAESGGLLYEAYYGYRYLPRVIRYNQAVSLTIDMAAYKYAGGDDPGNILVPQLDTRATNYWTITRTDGSSASDAAPAAYRQRRGTIVEQKTLDLLTDDVLLSHASWRTHLGVDGQGANYPSIPVDLAGNPELIEQYLTLDVGSRVQRTNQPVLAGIGVIDQVIVGMSETISPTSWSATLTATPGSVWTVGVYDDPGSLYDAATTTIAGTPPTTTSTAWTISSTNPADVWSTAGVPYDWSVAGEQVTVTVMNAATGSGPYVQTCTVTRAVNGIVKAHLFGEQVSLANPVRYAL